MEIRLVAKGHQEVKPALLESIGQDVVIVEVNSSGMYEIIYESKDKVYSGSMGVAREKPVEPDSSALSGAYGISPPASGRKRRCTRVRSAFASWCRPPGVSSCY